MKPAENPSSHDGRQTDLKFDKVSFAYGSQPVLEESNFHIHKGEFIALVGPNGAGKTTVLKLILGLEHPSSGNIELLGLPPAKARDRIGYVPQSSGQDPAFPISVREVVRMGRLRSLDRTKGLSDRAETDRALAQAGVADLSARSFASLSGGERRRVLVARALASSPGFLILDEPTANMDSASEERLFETLQRLKGATTILIVTHDTGFVSSLTDRVLCVGERGDGRKGRILVQHRIVPAENAPPSLFGGGAFKVLHDEDFPADDCLPVKDPQR
jgi:zinc transport system ATP-binding protein